MRRIALVLATLSGGCIDFEMLSRDLDAGAAGGDDGGGALCAGSSGLLLCEDFESGTIDATRWIKSEIGGTVTVDQAHARGQFALHVKGGGAPGTNLQAAIAQVGATPLPKEFYARVWIYASSATVPLDFLRLSFDPGPGYSSLWLLSTGQPMLLDSTGDSMNALNTIDFDRWNCLSWHVGGSPNAQEARLNGGMPFGLLRAGTYRSAQLGAENLGTTGTLPPFELWLDELAIGTSPLPCL
jgi:hypothetical protein